MITLVIFVAIKTPDTADDDEATDPVVPEIAQEVEAEIGAREGAFETDVIVDDHLGHLRVGHGMRRAGLTRASVVTQGADFPFRVDDTAIVWRQLGFRCLSHKRGSC